MTSLVVLQNAMTNHRNPLDVAQNRKDAMLVDKAGNDGRGTPTVRTNETSRIVEPHPPTVVEYRMQNGDSHSASRDKQHHHEQVQPLPKSHEVLVEDKLESSGDQQRVRQHHLPRKQRTAYVAGHRVPSSQQQQKPNQLEDSPNEQLGSQEEAHGAVEPRDQIDDGVNGNDEPCNNNISDKNNSNDNNSGNNNSSNNNNNNSNNNKGDDNDENQKVSDTGNASSSSKTTIPKWSERLHRQLVEAIYEIGVSHASPSVIMEHMTFLTEGGSGTTSQANVPTILNTSSSGSCDGRRNSLGGGSLKGGKGGTGDNNNEVDTSFGNNPVTSERVKSHLQKYRKNRSKSKDDFMNQYDAWLQNALTVGIASTVGNTGGRSRPSASMVLDLMGASGNALLGGELAAFLSYMVMSEESAEGEDIDPVVSAASTLVHGKDRSEGGFVTAASSSSWQNDAHDTQRSSFSGSSAPALVNSRKRGLSDYRYDRAGYSKLSRLPGARIPFPVLTEDERKSSLGESMSHVIGLFYSMTHHLLTKREQAGVKPEDGHENVESNQQLGRQGDAEITTAGASSGRDLHHIQHPGGLQNVVVEASLQNQSQLEQRGSKPLGANTTSSGVSPLVAERGPRNEPPMVTYGNSLSSGLYPSMDPRRQLQHVHQSSPAGPHALRHQQQLYQQEQYYHNRDGRPDVRIGPSHHSDYGVSQFREGLLQQHGEVVNYQRHGRDGSQIIESQQNSQQHQGISQHTQHPHHRDHVNSSRYENAPIPMTTVYESYYSDFGPVDASHNNSAGSTAPSADGTHD